MKDQGTSNVEAGNNFDDPNNTSQGVSRNTEWDILWQYPVNNGGGNAFTYYHLATSSNGYEPNSSSTALNYKSYNLNGASHPCTSSTCPGSAPAPDYSYPLSGNYPSSPDCYGLWKKDPTSQSTSHKRIKTNKLLVFPNPFDDLIRLQFSNQVDGRIKVLSLHGKEVINKTFTGKTENLNTTEWKPGTYFIKVISEKENFKTNKVTKVR